MDTLQMQKESLFQEIEKLHQRQELSKTVQPDYFEPGMMEYLAQSEGIYNAKTGEILIRFESRGTRYEGRTERIEKVKLGSPVQILREQGNPYNPNNFTIVTAGGKNIGNMPAQLCNAIAPLYDTGKLRFLQSSVSFVEPISQRSRHAKQAVLFVQLHMQLEFA